MPENVKDAIPDLSPDFSKAEADLAAIYSGQPIKSCSEISSALTTIVAYFRQLGMENRAHELDHERLACLLSIRPSISGSVAEKLTPAGRITGIATFSDGSVLPDVNDFDSTIYKYLDTRAKAVASPVLKARYNDLIFSKSDFSGKHLNGLAAIDAYLQAASGFAMSPVEFHRIEMITALDQSVFLAVSMSHEDKLRHAVETIHALLQTKATEEAGPHSSGADGNRPIGRWTMELARLLIYVKRHKKFQNLVSDEMMQETQQTLRRLADENGRKHLHHLQREMLDVVSAVTNQLNQPINWYEVQIETGRSLESQATYRLEGGTKSYLAAAAFYERAVQHYDRMRADPRLSKQQRVEVARLQDEAKKKIRPLYREGRSEMGVISAPLDISQNEVEEMLDSILQGASLKEKLRGIASEGSLIPNLKLARQLASEQSGLLAFLPMRSLRNDMTTHVTDSEDERYEAAVSSNVIRWIRINSAIILSGLFNRLRSDGLDTETLLEFFDDWGIIDEDNLEIIRTGLDRYFADDYVSSLHILVPQFEDIFRTLYEKSGSAVIESRRKGRGFEYTTFGSFLNDPTVENSMPEEIREYIKLVMTEQLGWNLRNDIAHGLLGPDGFTKPVVETVIHLYLILTLFEISPVDTFSDSDSAGADAESPSLNLDE